MPNEHEGPKKTLNRLKVEEQFTLAEAMKVEVEAGRSFNDYNTAAAFFEKKVGFHVTGANLRGVCKVAKIELKIRAAERAKDMGGAGKAKRQRLALYVAVKELASDLGKTDLVKMLDEAFA